eukprot:Gregarina_sp_Pseudo_9__4161@NODE_430_length_2848_cov_16_521538_g406_i0_p1_GENE_NODE_430_length_2848_cov_16_521538_g406_i0NODE_430_length_2848_cov_16_521538_g406_i0_p1_ORF_typecomplete_len844_score139_07DUF3336/PF11815_8/6_2e26Patatin/PF01734_22/4_5e25_NODE_430_length_2848_cov_16_521538_g406_i0942625
MRSASRRSSPQQSSAPVVFVAADLEADPCKKAPVKQQRGLLEVPQQTRRRRDGVSSSEGAGFSSASDCSPLMKARPRPVSASHSRVSASLSRVSAPHSRTSVSYSRHSARLLKERCLSSASDVSSSAPGRRVRLTRSELLSRSKTSLDHAFGKHRGQLIRVVFSMPFLLLGLCALLCFLFTRVSIRLLSWIGLDSSVRSLRKKLHHASSIEEYEAIARQLDKATGCEAWKAEGRSASYDHKRVAIWTRALRKFRSEGNIHRLCDVLSQAQNLKFGHVFTEEVFSHCHWGTKYAIEDFFAEIRSSLSCILNHVQSPVFRNEPCGEVIRFIHDFSANWGQTALYLSGGGMIGFHHFGIGKALLQLRLVPSILVGCSAGSAVAAWLASRTNHDAQQELKDEDFARVFSPFENISWRMKLANLLLLGYLCSSDSWTQCARRVYGDLTLAEAYDRTGRMLNVSACRADENKVSSTGAYLLNCNNAPSVLLRSAVLASSAFPLLSTPFTLLEKLPSGDICPSKRFHAVPFRDGCLMADIPLSLVSRECDVGFSIVAQVNPHVYPFLSLQSRARAGRPARKQLVRRGQTLLSLLGRMEEFFKEVLRSIIRLGVSLDVWPTFNGVDTSNMMNQTYRGDVTLLPRRIFWTHRFAATNLTRDADIKWYLNEGMIMAFEKTPLIRARLVIEELVSSLKMEVMRLGPRRRLKTASATRSSVECCGVYDENRSSLRRSTVWAHPDDLTSDPTTSCAAFLPSSSRLSPEVSVARSALSSSRSAIVPSPATGPVYNECFYGESSIPAVSPKTSLRAETTTHFHSLRTLDDSLPLVRRQHRRAADPSLTTRPLLVHRAR